MAHKALDVYLNDHFGGATMGANLAEQIADHAEGTPLAAVMDRLHAEIEEDRDTLRDLMQRLDVDRNPVKQATGWLAETAKGTVFDPTRTHTRAGGPYLSQLSSSSSRSSRSPGSTAD